MKVLIVDDHLAIRQTMRLLVASLADEISECSDGAEAMTQYTTTKPDWVLMDVQMKVMNGITATEQIKAAYPDARIVIVTSFDDAGLREAAFQAGACGYVLKENLLELRQILQTNGTNPPTIQGRF